jgi:MerR family copper efflux transcriptional regulator
MRIGELARQAGCTVKAVRFYEARGLLPRAARTPSGYRHYGATEARRLLFIRRAKQLGLSLEKIRALVAHLSDDERPGAAVRPHLERLLGCELEEIDARLEHLGALREELERVLEGMRRARALPRELCVCASPPR